MMCSLQFLMKKKLLDVVSQIFATSFVTLQSLFDMKDILNKLFVFNMSNKSSWVKTTKGNQIMNAMLSTNFLNILEDYLRASQPLVALLR